VHLPYGVDRTLGPVVRLDGIHDGVSDGRQWALPLRRIDHDGFEVFAEPVLNPFLAQGRASWHAVRAELLRYLTDPEALAAVVPAFVPVADLELVLPIEVGDYVDFYSSIHHATRVGRIFRPEGEPLLPNYRHLPVGYHGRSGTVVVSGTPVRRPAGLVPDGEGSPALRPSAALDFELELGVVLGSSSAMGEAIPIDEAAEHLFGVALVSDWSARDIQAFEAQPLGPFLGKSFATSMAAWITPFEALEHHLVPGPQQEPAPAPHLRARAPWGLDLQLEVWLRRSADDTAKQVTAVDFASMYWTVAQQLAHLTTNGASTRAGDLCASGTVSGPEPGSEGCLLESGLGYLGDGDEVRMRGRAGHLELGEVVGTIVGAEEVA
jgi:fumarylacetoacetase